MIEIREELSGILKQGKEALSKNDLAIAINSFERAIKIACEVSPALNSIIGISYAYLALAFGKNGIKALALENINKATEFFPENPTKPLIFAQLLLALGISFQKIELYECSIILLKNALSTVKSKSVEVDLEAISIVARNLGFSYSKIGNNVSSAKLYRIAADLEDEPQMAIDLYRNSAYLYYQEKMKEYALDILQTAFDKAGILGDNKSQQDIAYFQGLVSYEIASEFIQKGYLEKALAYLDLCNDKFTFTEDSLFIIKSLYEKAMILEKLGKDWQRNKVLEKIIRFKVDEKNKEYFIKAIFLLIIHALEGEHYSKADFYIQQVSELQLHDINPQISQKIQEIREMLNISRERGQLHADLHFTRKDLDLPIDDLIPEATSTQEITSSQNTLKSLQVPRLDIIAPPSASTRMKQPSVEALQELFETSEEAPIITTDQDILSINTQDSVLVDELEERGGITTLSETTLQHNQEKVVALERLFRAHQASPEPSEQYFSSQDPTGIEFSTADEPITQSVRETPEVSSFPSPTVSQDKNIRSDVVSRLQRAGWAVELNFTNLTQRGSEPDIIATKGLIRKTRKLIFFAENPADAEICSFLLQSNTDKGEKFIFLLSGNPRDANISVMVKLITQIGQLF
ncbi:MAG: hypothetical protein ACFFB2_01065 [Promethearchaeota archaeon]